MKGIEDYIITIPDFPEEGVMFRDVTSVLQDEDGFRLAVDLMQKKLEGLEFDVIAGAESRGFFFAAPLAYNLHKPFVPVRKRENSQERPYRSGMNWSMTWLSWRSTGTPSNPGRRWY